MFCLHRPKTETALSRRAHVNPFFATLLSALVCTVSAADDKAFSRPFDFAPSTATVDGAGVILGALELTAMLDDRPHQLSGLAWDADEEILYALSDDAYILHLQPVFKDGRLISAGLLAVVELRDRNGEILRGRHADSEGLALNHATNGASGDTELYISFEQHPRIERYNAAGMPSGTVEFENTSFEDLPFRHANRQFEALTRHDDYGLLTAPERPLTDSDGSVVVFFSERGTRWEYPLPEPDYASVVGATTRPNGNLLILERHLGSPLSPLSIRVAEAALPRAGSTRLERHQLLSFDSSKGWPVDNFEGVAHHTAERYFMISDDNHRTWQKTLLVYFDLAALSAQADAASVQPGCMDACESPAGAQ